ncbi:MAG: hypothetical protein AAGJ80_19870, partial [Cyanobacteria bacterium J06553_1]
MSNVKIVTESKDSFYVHLLSNAQPDVFKNIANHFKCQFQTALQFPSDEAWEIALKEYHYVNNIDTITKDLKIEVGRLAPNRETWRSFIRSPNSVVHDTAQMDYPFYFTECGTQLTTYKPFQDILDKQQQQQRFGVHYAQVCRLRHGKEDRRKRVEVERRLRTYKAG